MEEAERSKSSSSSPHNTYSSVPLEIVSEEEMAFIEAALSAAATRSLSLSLSSSSSSIAASSSLPTDSANLKRVAASLRPQRMLAGCSNNGKCLNMEDFCAPKKMRVLASLFQQFRSRKGLSVTDITASEWCEKRMEFTLLHGKPKKTKAMKVGSARHVELEEEVVKKVEIRIKSIEEQWALKFMKFIVGVNQLLSEGLTRELPVIGLVEGVWMIGVIDEIRMPMTEPVRNPTLVDTKTRSTTTLPSEAQKRNARLQLMCYKYLLDKMVADNFPSSSFFDFFGLNPECTFSDDVRLYITGSGFQAETFREFVVDFSKKCCLLPAAHEQLLLRYEYQGDHSLLEEYHFTYDADWLKNQVLQCLKFWMGEREAAYVPDDERWKCGLCSFAARCPMTKSPAGS